MATVILTAAPRRISPTQIEVSYSNGIEGSTYYIYRNGELESRTTDTTATLTVTPFERPQFDIFDAPTAGIQFFPERAVIQMNVSAGCTGIVVEEQVDATWITRQNLIVTDESVVEYESRVLEDDSTHTFRATPYDEAGNAGEASVFPFKMIRRPDHDEAMVEPQVDGTLRITISA